MNENRHFVRNNKGQLLIFLIAAMIPFQINLGNIAIIMAFVFALYLGVSKKLNKKDFNHFAFYFPIFFFLISLMSALTSRNIHEGIRGIDKNLLLVLIPFIIFAIKRSSETLKQILTVFSISTLFSTIILFVYGLIRVSQGASSKVFFFHEFSSLFDQHAVYYALYLAISSFALTHYYLKNLTYKDKFFWLILLSIFILLCSIFLTASKAVIFVFSILYFIQLISFLSNRKTQLLVTFTFFLTCLILVNIPIIKNRYIEGLEFNIEKFTPTTNIQEAIIFSHEDKEEISDLELRYIFLKIGIYHLIKDKEILFGYGEGDVQDKLDYYYLTYGLAPNWYEGYNVHNQYLHILICYGAFVFLFFLCYLGFSFYQAIKHKGVVHLFFLITTCFVFIFEVMLERNKGLVFFYFFNTLFLFNYLDFENSDIRHTRSTE